ncbi:hypothetical protein QQA05_00375 [Corynebacterium macclintockiae]|uniref:hypothetical protein n=1 Tax=Corynebacterium macclintockiae TaxID=2913501 RepID=UPI00254E43B0|nr:hypothetical protein [Corynebacterium macclintockiae]MDK8889870.1 hypothetical protein [Corynebacterium macclintockiae]
MTSNHKRLEELQQQAKALAEQIEQLEDQINNAQPTTGLLGRWAKHPQYGDVLITMDRPLDSRAIGIMFLSANMEGGVAYRRVNIDDLDFPDQTTRPQDVPVGEAWLVDATDGYSNQHNTPALKIGASLWVTPIQGTNDENEWHNYEITLITPLIPARPQGTPETVTTEEEYESLPVGSVVAAWKGIPWVRRTHAWVSVGNSLTTSEMTETTRYILRRGWGE